MKPLESISSTFLFLFFSTKFWGQKLQSCVFGFKFFGVKILAEKCVQNVDEIDKIDYWSQFRQHFTHEFFAQKVHSKPNSKQRKTAQKTFLQKMRS